MTRSFLLYLFLFAALGLSVTPKGFSQENLHDLPLLTPGKVGMKNALWIENDLSLQFSKSSRIVIADIKGSATITMIHFALPSTLKLNRDVLIKMYWDGEKEPSVDCPLVDFFCDPAGTRDEVNSLLVNKRRGWNAYFPMPFRRSAKIELVYDGPLSPGQELWQAMPAYSYVMYRTAEKIPADSGYFHAHWRQAAVLIGKQDYVALDAKGKGKFVGWNVTIRRPTPGDYPVDVNEKFFVDGEKTASVEFQGLEDSFGFSWGFPETPSLFPRTGFFPFLNGAAGYRFFMQDAISFEKSLRVAIGFGLKEFPFFIPEFSKPGTMLQLSSTAYWYQQEPHAALPRLPAAADRAPAPQSIFWPGKEKLPSAEELRGRGVKLEMLCGRPEKEVIFAEPGFAAEVKTGYAYAGWAPPVYHCRADNKEVQIELTVPTNTPGKLRLFVMDPDCFQGGRKEAIQAAGKSWGTIEGFADGRWLERDLTADETKNGKILIQVTNVHEGANAVISVVEWIAKQ
jgi:Protein of unknown function (DUF2961)